MRQSQVLYWAQDPYQNAIFLILHEHGSALTGLKHCYTVFYFLYVVYVFSKDCCMENIVLMFTHTNALNFIKGCCYSYHGMYN